MIAFFLNMRYNSNRNMGENGILRFRIEKPNGKEDDNERFFEHFESIVCHVV